MRNFLKLEKKKGGEGLFGDESKVCVWVKKLGKICGFAVQDFNLKL